MSFEDLQHILPEHVRASLSGRKIIVALVTVICFLGVIVIALSASLAHHHVSTPSNVANLPATSLTDAGSDPGPFAPQQKASTEDTEWPSKATYYNTQSLQSMNPEVDYCDNFYKFACGGWMKKADIHPDTGFVSTWTQVADDSEQRIRRLLEEPIKDNTVNSMDRKIKQLYRMCLHEFGRAKTGAKPLARILTEDLGGWYAADPVNWKNTWDFKSAFSKLQGDYMVDVFLKVSVGLDAEDMKSRVLLAENGGLGMEYNYYFEIKGVKLFNIAVQELYKNYMRQTIRLLLRDANLNLTISERDRRVEQFVLDAYGHESKMANGIFRLRRSPDYSQSLRISVGDLSQNYTQVNWQSLFQGMFETTSVKQYSTSPIISSETMVTVKPKGYFDFLESVFKNETANRDRILHNYMIWRFLDTYTRELSWEYTYARLRFEEALSGRVEFTPRWRTCVDVIRRRLPAALAGLALQRHLDTPLKTQISTLVENINQAFLERIDELSWMDSATKERAKDKMTSLQQYLLLPDHWFNQTFIDSLYEQLVVDEDNGYFTSLLNTNHYMRVFRTKELTLGYRHALWLYALDKEGMGVHPLYTSHYNALLVPIGTAHRPLFSIDANKYANYGALGTAIAYEMIHSINELGHYEWKNGSFTDWWSKDTATQYRKSEKCFEKYFTNMTIGPFQINGENKTVTLNARGRAWRAVDEQAAIRAAYVGYMKWVQENQNEVGLSRLTAEQSFFLISAQSHCIKMRDTLAYRWAVRDRIPEEYLVNGVLRNMPEFSNAFNCSGGSIMSAPVLANTCTVF